jgi:hypothetical protein
MSVKCLRLETDLGDELALKESLKILGVGGFGLGEHALVDELVNCWALHLGEGRSWCGEEVVVAWKWKHS